MSRKTGFAEFAKLHDYTLDTPPPKPEKPTKRYSEATKPDISHTDVKRMNGGKGYYDISFYVDTTSPVEWNELLKRLSQYHKYVTFFITMQGRQVRYIIEKAANR